MNLPRTSMIYQFLALTDREDFLLDAIATTEGRSIDITAERLIRQHGTLSEGGC